MLLEIEEEEDKTGINEVTQIKQLSKQKIQKINKVIQKINLQQKARAILRIQQAVGLKSKPKKADLKNITIINRLSRKLIKKHTKISLLRKIVLFSFYVHTILKIYIKGLLNIKVPFQAGKKDLKTI